ncbi:MAG TPA: class I SAM-dependent methyltransferase [Candidatus Dormibacteraeota bacterium]|nr:class I SAM-dependent methyltransferase [Candidatus Dormibacteraeota bacterium]
MRPAFLELLRCPDCGAALAAAPDALACPAGHRFPVVRDVPRFVDSEQYVGNFGFEWNRHRRTQLDGPDSDESERTFRRKTGFQPADLAGALVLDAGCGMGRFSDVASRWGATVVGVDLSGAVDAAHANLGGRERVHIAQGDIFRLPFPEATFDVVFSIGVLHHTPDTRAAFERLVRLVKPGGRIAIWVYTSYANGQWAVSNLLRRWTWRLSPRVLHALAHVAVPKYYVDRLPAIGRVSRMLLPVSGHPRSEWRVLDTFDWYSPRYQWKHTYEEVFPWFEAQGLTDIRVLGAPVALQGRRPA